MDTTPKELTEDNQREMRAPKPAPDDDEEDVEAAVPGNKLT